MQITHMLKIDLLDPGTVQRIQVKQGDTLSRNIELQLFTGQEPWTIPTDAKSVIRYHIHDLEGFADTKGIYDQLPSGQLAYQFDGNRLQFFPAPAMFARHSVISVDVVFLKDGQQLATANFEFYVNRSPNVGTDTEPQSYYRLFTLEQINQEIMEFMAILDNMQNEVDLIREEWEAMKADLNSTT